jgi:hypothetical protein
VELKRVRTAGRTSIACDARPTTRSDRCCSVSDDLPGVGVIDDIAFDPHPHSDQLFARASPINRLADLAIHHNSLNA